MSQKRSKDYVVLEGHHYIHKGVRHKMRYYIHKDVWAHSVTPSQTMDIGDWTLEVTSPLRLMAMSDWVVDLTTDKLLKCRKPVVELIEGYINK